MAGRRLVWVLSVAWLAAVPFARAQCGWDPDELMRGPSDSLAEGTRFTVVLESNLPAGKVKPGQPFSARLAENLLAPNGAMISRNSKIKGHVAGVAPEAQGGIQLAFDSIQSQHGWIPLAASVLEIPAEGSKSAQEGQAGAIEPASASTPGAGTGTGKSAAGHLPRLNKGRQLLVQLDQPLQVPKK